MGKFGIELGSFITPMDAFDDGSKIQQRQPERETPPTFNQSNYPKHILWLHYFLKTVGIVCIALVFGGIIGFGLRYLVRFIIG